MAKPLSIVTGTSSGIGRSIALRLLAEGNSVVGVSRGSNLRHKINSKDYQDATMDVSQLKSLELCLQNLSKDYPNPSSIIFCAGYGEFGNLEEFSFDQIRKLIDTNLTSQLYLARTFLPLMKKSRSGDLVFIGSESSLSGGRRGAAYVASKSGLLGVARALRQECSSSGIRVSIINLGMTRTPFYDDAAFTHGENSSNYIESEDVATMVVTLLKMRAGTVVDEIRMTPLKSVIRRQNH